MFKVPRHEIGLETPADIRLNRGHKSHLFCQQFSELESETNFVRIKGVRTLFEIRYEKVDFDKVEFEKV